MKVVVTGARGLLGSELKHTLGSHGSVIGWSSGAHDGYRQVDITRPWEIERGLDDDCPDVVVNCAANPNVASCESDPDAARELNALTVQKIAAAVRSRNIRLVHISSDYVFAGDKEGGYVEADPPSPLQAYGRTKAEGERYCLDLPYGLVVRLPLLFGIGRASTRTTFPEGVVHSLRAGREIPADGVEFRQPTLTSDVAKILNILIAKEITGIVHVAAQQGTTKYDWAVGIAERAALDRSLIRRTEPAKDSQRPLRSWLNVRRLEELGIAPARTVRAATDAFLAEAKLL